MTTQPKRPAETKQNRASQDDKSSAPESGTAVDATSGNQPARPNERPAPMKQGNKHQAQPDDPSVAGEER